MNFLWELTVDSDMNSFVQADSCAELLYIVSTSTGAAILLKIALKKVWNKILFVQLMQLIFVSIRSKYLTTPTSDATKTVYV